jgi:hypothetical protein
MIFAEHVAKQADEIAKAKKRIGEQAAARATSNGTDPVAASIQAEDLFTPNCCHETIVAAVAGEYRGRKAA